MSDADRMLMQAGASPAEVWKMTRAVIELANGSPPPRGRVEARKDPRDGGNRPGAWPTTWGVDMGKDSDFEIRAREALAYISSPTMGLPAGRDALDYVDEASEANVRAALKACIRTARMGSIDVATPKYLTTAEVAELCRTSSESVRYWRHIGTGPTSFKVGRRVLYDVADVEQWLNALRAADRPGRQ